MNSKALPERSTAAAFLSALHRRGIHQVFANAGTDFAPVIEALSAAQRTGDQAPQFMTIPHEAVAMAMAQGYARQSGAPAAVMVHVSVGTANALCGLMNAARDHIPLLLMAGRTPLTESGAIGARSIGIHWGQESFDQAAMVREFVKWDYELRAGQPVDTIIGRALDIAMTEPRGPVYLSLPREVLGCEHGAPGPGPRARPLGTPTPAPAPDPIAQAADLIAAAKNPLILAGRTGARRGGAQALGDLTQDFALPVVHVNQPCLPSAHPMNLGFDLKERLEAADVIVVLECAVPWIPQAMAPRPDAKLIHIAVDPLYGALPQRGFPFDVAIAGDPLAALRLLHEALDRKTKRRSAGSVERLLKIKSAHAVLEKRRARQISEAATAHPISPVWVAACLNQIKTPDTIIINELGIPIDILDHTAPDSYIGVSEAGGLGAGLGLALGAKLAVPERDVILAVGDGSYIFGNPTAAHMTAHAHSLPTLTVICNNSMWYAVRRATLAMYPDGEASKANDMPLVDLSPSPAFERMMEACGGWGGRVEDPADLPGALAIALKKVRGGTPALLNVITGPGGRG